MIASLKGVWVARSCPFWQEGLKDDYRPASTHKNHLAVSDMTFKGFFKGLGQAFKYLLTPQLGQQAPRRAAGV